MLSASLSAPRRPKAGAAPRPKERPWAVPFSHQSRRKRPSGGARRARRLSRDAIRAVESRLRQLGFYSGLIDGIWGPNMQASLQRFQQGRGLQATGQPNPATVTALWSGSEQSCRSAGNFRPNPVTANPALVYLFAAVAAGRMGPASAPPTHIRLNVSSLRSSRTVTAAARAPLMPVGGPGLPSPPDSSPSSTATAS